MAVLAELYVVAVAVAVVVALYFYWWKVEAIVARVAVQYLWY